MADELLHVLEAGQPMEFVVLEDFVPLWNHPLQPCCTYRWEANDDAGFVETKVWNQ